MKSKKFILNADDFGMSDYYNNAVLDAYNFGMLKSASICSNGDAFESAVKTIIPNCKMMSVGIHLNIIEGKSLGNHTLLTDVNNRFNNGFIKLLIKSFDKNFLKETEAEFRLQIEKAINSGVKLDHIDSHVHVHAIPKIFNIVCRLAKEYNISQVRTQYEHFYITPVLSLHKTTYLINLVKVLLLNGFSLINKPKIKKYGLETNDYLIGVAYTSMMNDKTVYHGLKSLKKNSTVEALIHPCKYDNGEKDSHSTEFDLTVDPKLKEAIGNLGYELSNYQKN